MSIDAAFEISKDGILSVTVRYSTDSSFIRARMAVPVNKSGSIGYNLYLILLYDDESVIVYESSKGSKVFKEVAKNTLFHIGESEGDGYYKL